MKKSITYTLCAVCCLSASAQWGNVGENLVVFNKANYYEHEMAIAPNGCTWLYINYPEDGVIKSAVQLYSSEGERMLGNDTVMLLSDYPTLTSTTVNQYLMCDVDGNAVVAVQDLRNAVEQRFNSYTVYKISQTGEMLWGKDGITLDSGASTPLNAHITSTQLSDGSYVFAWMAVDTTTNQMTVRAERLSATGESLWDVDEVALRDASGSTMYQYPTVVDGGNNQVLMVYAKGTNKDLYVRKIDFDGTSVWSEDVCIYRGGWGNIPIHTLLDIHPSGDGGVIVSWNDDRYYTQIESAYMTYVKPNGEIGFAAGVEGQKLGYSGYRALSVKCQYDPATDSFIAFWRETNTTQTYYRLVAQRVSKTGELLWDEDGLEITPYEETTYGYLSLENGADDEMAFFYMRNYSNSYGSNVESFVTTLNTTDTSKRRDCEFTKGETTSRKDELTVTSMHEGKYWVTKWQDGAANNQMLTMQRLNNDFTVGNTAVKGVKADSNLFTAVSTVVKGEAMFAVNMPAEAQATLVIYDMNGRLVDVACNKVLPTGKSYLAWGCSQVANGIYLATLTTPAGIQTVKLLVNN